jgi:hypothetical protein
MLLLLKYINLGTLSDRGIDLITKYVHMYVNIIYKLCAKNIQICWKKI